MIQLVRTGWCEQMKHTHTLTRRLRCGGGSSSQQRLIEHLFVHAFLYLYMRPACRWGGGCRGEKKKSTNLPDRKTGSAAGCGTKKTKFEWVAVGGKGRCRGKIKGATETKRVKEKRPLLKTVARRSVELRGSRWTLTALPRSLLWFCWYTQSPFGSKVIGCGFVVSHL